MENAKSNAARRRARKRNAAKRRARASAPPRVVRAPIHNTVAKPDLNEAERLYLEAVTNPFGHSPGGGSSPPVGAKVLDTVTRMTVPLTCIRSSTHEVNVATTHFAFKLKFPMQYAASAPLANVGHQSGYSTTVGQFDGIDDFDTVNYQLLRDHVTNVRVVGAGLKVNVTCGGDNVSGYFVGGNQAVPLIVTNVGSTSTLIADRLPDIGYPAEDGITVRWTPGDARDYEMKTPAEYGINAYYDSPTVLFQGGIVGGTTFVVESVIHLEIEVSVDYCPGASRSPVSLSWQLIQALAGDDSLQPLVTKGHSFRDLFRTSAARIKHIQEMIKRYGPAVSRFLTVAHSALTLMA
jgi:hypothetical protein